MKKLRIFVLSLLLITLSSCGDVDMVIYYNEDFTSTIECSFAIDKTAFDNSPYTIESVRQQIEKNPSFTTGEDFGKVYANQYIFYAYSQDVNLKEALGNGISEDIDYNLDIINVEIETKAFQSYLLSFFDEYTIEQLKDMDAQIIITFSFPGNILETNSNHDHYEYYYEYETSFDILNFEEPYIQIEAERFFNNDDAYIDYDNWQDENEELTTLAIIATIIGVSLLAVIILIVNNKRKKQISSSKEYVPRSMRRIPYKKDSMQKPVMKQQSKKDPLEKASFFSRIQTIFEEIKTQSIDAINENTQTNKENSDRNPYESAPNTIHRKYTNTYQNKDQYFIKEETSDSLNKDTVIDETTKPDIEENTTEYISALSNGEFIAAEPAVEAEPAEEAEPAKAVDEL